MELRASFQIPTLIKAMTDVVLPAVDPNNKLAQEQAQLIVGCLHLMAQRLPMQYRYDRHELKVFVALAAELQREASGGTELADALATLREGATSGQEVLARAGAEPSELEAANLKMRDAVGRLIVAASTSDDEVRRSAIDKAVMAHAKDQLLRERAWLALQGWEGKTPLPDLESLIGD
jgi:hypothetical protein